jgi:hypothetical protein
MIFHEHWKENGLTQAKVYGIIHSSHYHEMLGLRTVLRTTLMMPTKAILLVGPAYIQG